MDNRTLMMRMSVPIDQVLKLKGEEPKSYNLKEFDLNKLHLVESLNHRTNQETQLDLVQILYPYMVEKNQVTKPYVVLHLHSHYVSFTSVSRYYMNVELTLSLLEDLKRVDATLWTLFLDDKVKTVLTTKEEFIQKATEQFNDYRVNKVVSRD